MILLPKKSVTAMNLNNSKSGRASHLRLPHPGSSHSSPSVSQLPLNAFSDPVCTLGCTCHRLSFACSLRSCQALCHWLGRHFWYRLDHSLKRQNWPQTSLLYSTLPPGPNFQLEHFLLAHHSDCFLNWELFLAWREPSDKFRESLSQMVGKPRA